MSVSRIEALAMAISEANGAFDPSSRASQNANPGLLKSFSLVRHQETDSNGVRIFTSFIGGFRALLHDLTLRCQGKSRATVWHGGERPEKLRVDSSLSDLLRTYGLKVEAPMHKIVQFLRIALSDESISLTTPIGFFVLGVPLKSILREEFVSRVSPAGSGVFFGLALTQRAQKEE